MRSLSMVKGFWFSFSIWKAPPSPEGVLVLLFLHLIWIGFAGTLQIRKQRLPPKSNHLITDQCFQSWWPDLRKENWGGEGGGASRGVLVTSPHGVSFSKVTFRHLSLLTKCTFRHLFLTECAFRHLSLTRCTFRHPWLGVHLDIYPWLGVHLDIYPWLGVHLDIYPWLGVNSVKEISRLKKQVMW